jgi:dihydrofolate reductase
MRTLKLQMQLSLDGFVAGAKGEMDWMVWDWDDELKEYVTSITTPVDCILLGRVLAEGFIPTWAGLAATSKTPDEDGSRKMNDTPKVVFSKTLTNADVANAHWQRTTLAQGELAEEIKRLKEQPGGDIIAYGGGTFVSNLIKHNLIDEYHLFVNPTALGRGMSIFGTLEHKFPLKLVRTQSFSCGIAVLCYKSQ